MDDGKSPLIPKLSIILIGVASAALAVTIYHCIAVGWCNLRRPPVSTQRAAQPPFAQEDIPSSFENSMVQLIPVHKYQKGSGLVGDYDGTCAVCLSEFEEGEELRTLPECLHSFHVECIDMWLFSHPNCPMCRANATPSPSLRID